MRDISVCGYKFYRSSGRSFDDANLTFVPEVGKSADCKVYELKDDATSQKKIKTVYHECVHLEPKKDPYEFFLTNRCLQSWRNLSCTQKSCIDRMEDEINTYRKDKENFCRIIFMEGPGGCGKTRLMSHVINHPHRSSLVIYATKQNKRVQDFICDEVYSGEMENIKPLTDMSKMNGGTIKEVLKSAVGSFACTVEKLIYNTSNLKTYALLNSRGVVQTELQINDEMYSQQNNNRLQLNRTVVLLLDEYTMLPPPMIHKLVHCIWTWSESPLVVIMAGDRFQLGPINWNIKQDGDYDGEKDGTITDPEITSNRRFYTSDIRTEVAARLHQTPVEIKMDKLQRCKGDSKLRDTVLYLRRACEHETSFRAIQRHIISFCEHNGIKMFRYSQPKQTAGRILPNDEPLQDLDEGDDQHISDTNNMDDIDECVDYSDVPAIDMDVYIEKIAGVYKRFFLALKAGTSKNAMHRFIYDNLIGYVSGLAPVFMVKTNDKCNRLSDAFLKALFAGVQDEVESTILQYRSSGQHLHNQPRMGSNPGYANHTMLTPLVTNHSDKTIQNLYANHTMITPLVTNHSDKTIQNLYANHTMKNQIVGDNANKKLYTDITMRNLMVSDIKNQQLYANLTVENPSVTNHSDEVEVMNEKQDNLTEHNHQRGEKRKFDICITTSSINSQSVESHKVTTINEDQSETDNSFGLNDGTTVTSSLTPEQYLACKEETREFMKNMGVSLLVNDSPVQQTLIVGMPYKITETIRSERRPVLSNGEIVMVCEIGLNDDTIEFVRIRPIQRADREFMMTPGHICNRLNGKESPTKNIFPLVPLVCENIYQMQGNTIYPATKCYVDLVQIKRNDIYVAVSRFQSSSSIHGIVLDAN